MNQDICRECLCRPGIKGVCHICGRETAFSNWTFTMTCPRCGDILATSDIPGCSLDNTIYELEIDLPGWNWDRAGFLKLARLLSKNSVEVKRLLDSGEALKIKGPLRELVPLYHALSALSVSCAWGENIVKRFSLFFTCDRSLWNHGLR